MTGPQDGSHGSTHEYSRGSTHGHSRNGTHARVGTHEYARTIGRSGIRPFPYYAGNVNRSINPATYEDVNGSVPRRRALR